MKKLKSSIKYIYESLDINEKNKTVRYFMEKNWDSDESIRMVDENTINQNLQMHLKDVPTTMKIKKQIKDDIAHCQPVQQVYDFTRSRKLSGAEVER